MLELLDKEYPFIAFDFRSPLVGEVSPDRDLSMGPIELNCVLILSGIVFDIEIAYLCKAELFEIELF